MAKRKNNESTTDGDENASANGDGNADENENKEVNGGGDGDGEDDSAPQRRSSRRTASRTSKRRRSKENSGITPPDEKQPKKRTRKNDQGSTLDDDDEDIPDADDANDAATTPKEEPMIEENNEENDEKMEEGDDDNDEGDKKKAAIDTDEQQEQLQQLQNDGIIGKNGSSSSSPMIDTSSSTAATAEHPTVPPAENLRLPSQQTPGKFANLSDKPRHPLATEVPSAAAASSSSTNQLPLPPPQQRFIFNKAKSAPLVLSQPPNLSLSSENVTTSNQDDSTAMTKVNGDASSHHKPPAVKSEATEASGSRTRQQQQRQQEQRVAAKQPPTAKKFLSILMTRTFPCFLLLLLIQVTTLLLLQPQQITTALSKAIESSDWALSRYQEYFGVKDAQEQYIQEFIHNKTMKEAAKRQVDQEKARKRAAKVAAAKKLAAERAAKKAAAKAAAKAAKRALAIEEQFELTIDETREDTQDIIEELEEQKLALDLQLRSIRANATKNFQEYNRIRENLSKQNQELLEKHGNLSLVVSVLSPILAEYNKNKAVALNSSAIADAKKIMGDDGNKLMDITSLVLWSIPDLPSGCPSNIINSNDTISQIIQKQIPPPPSVDGTAFNSSSMENTFSSLNLTNSVSFNESAYLTYGKLNQTHEELKQMSVVAAQQMKRELTTDLIDWIRSTLDQLLVKPEDVDSVGGGAGNVELLSKKMDIETEMEKELEVLMRMEKQIRAEMDQQEKEDEEEEDEDEDEEEEDEDEDEDEEEEEEVEEEEEEEEDDDEDDDEEEEEVVVVTAETDDSDLQELTALVEYQEQKRDQIEDDLDEQEERLLQLEEQLKEAEEEAEVYEEYEPDGLTVGEVRKHIQERLEIALADQTGRVDYAALHNGATVIHTGSHATSESLKDQLPLLNRLMSQVGLRFYGYGPEAALIPTNPIDALGQCWSFMDASKQKTPAKKTVTSRKSRDYSTGFFGTLTISLPKPIHVSSVVIEHPPRELSDQVKSSIRSFRVVGYEDPSAASDPFSLGRFEYNISGPKSRQEFQLQTSVEGQTVPKLQSITLAIDSTWGFPYACLYRFRVHSVEEDEAFE